MSEQMEDPPAVEDGEEEDEDVEESDAETGNCELLHSPPADYTPLAPSLDSSATYPWSRWVDSLRRKRGYRTGTYVDGWFDGPSVDRDDIDLTLCNKRPWDQVSGGTASILGTMKTASMSVPPSSAPRSRTNTITSNSNVVSRQSMESTRSSIYDAITQAGKVMAIRRRHVLREIYSSEVHYVDGLQTVVQILSTYLTMRPAILRDLQRLYDMHDAFRKQLQSVSPRSAETWLDGTPIRKSTILQKFQNQSLTRNIRRRANSQMGKEGADPSEALLVAKEVDKLTTKFHLYEAFIRSYDVLSEDLTLLRQNHPAAGFWTEGIEALQKSVHSTQKRKENYRKAMTLDDLIAKATMTDSEQPVQRVCKYQLLLTELLRTVPETTYPLTHSEIKKVLDRNSQAVDRINTVVGDPNLRIRIQKTISLHERLDYGDQNVLENVYQELGPLILCGVLHVAYQSSSSGIAGQYLVCILFPGYMVLARARSDSRKLVLIASIYLSDMTVDNSMNGHGLACLDTPFSWKIIFQYGQKRYEFIFSASSSAEERGWKTEILKASVMPPNEVPNISLEPRRFSCVCMPLAPLEADGRSLLLERRGSLRTSSPRSPLRHAQNQVIIKKTHNPIYDTEVRLLHESEPTRSRSDAKQNVSTPTVLIPLRSHRVKLERSISGIYSQELLPYPGMTLGRSDYMSQTMVGKTVMRGLSIRGVFHSRRSASLSKATSVSLDDGIEQDRDEQGKGVASEKVGTHTTLCDALCKSKDVTGDDVVAAKTFGSFRQKMTKTTSDNGTDEENVIKTKNKPWVPWKRWLPPAIVG
ncbi:Rho guanyl nucleotide exchange factor, putative [Talaromyces stipitatus ATCC 10500]|uniref:Rho guanyl nucleotide exchange factor, putative n=1 Tax=Talaromyces stipitatus (strain ATCC 10500 / CBS 375.48 / QM 6759 / NRRL 1006) TaxID=441959 RepID=B8LZ39_TALSN|nr:Rho guanyl nucleotide exchange factor, putative [Talaromyces stipitatus ATCC 10500]EED21083.1 Rho guanyl nucleotide exchange factor, putative [Talaromyces stipitatus ATCC 10500]